MINCLIVGIGGFMGSILRYLMSKIPIKGFSNFPINTLAINVLGAFLIGIIFSLVSKNLLADERIILLLKIGLCGGFTTFSTFSLESISLISQGHICLAIIYIFLSIVLCIGAVFFGESII